MMKISQSLTLPYHLLGMILVLLFLQGCQSVPQDKLTRQNHQDEHQRQAQLALIKRWQVEGKLIFKSPEQKFSVSLNWTQHDSRSDIRLTTFMGMSMMKMVNDGFNATLHSEGKTYTSDSPEQLLYKTTGITLPIEELPQWMKGASGEYQQRTIEFDQFNRIKQIRLLDKSNNPWQIDYLAYQDVAEHQLPKKIRLQGSDITATIKISTWELNPSD